MLTGYIWSALLAWVMAAQKAQPLVEKHVVIIGGGVAGLSASHVLSREPGLKITVLEQHPSAGGHSRSENYVDQDGFTRVFDAGWRVFTDSYDDLFPLLSEVPFEENDNNPKSTVRSHLVPLDSGTFVNRSHKELLYEMWFGDAHSSGRVGNLAKFLQDLSAPELVRVASVIALSIFGSDERLDSYEDLTFNEFAYMNVDENTRSTLFRGVANGLLPVIFGQNRHVTSANTSLHLLNRIVGTFHSSGGATYFFPGPPNKTVFEPWTRFLEKRNVDIRLNSFVDNLLYDENGRVGQVVATNKKTGQTEYFHVDHVVVATHPHDAARLLQDQNLSDLAKRSEVHFSGLNVYFSKRVVNTKSVYWYVPSPWHVAAITFDGYWRPEFFDSNNTGVQQILNFVLCDFETRGTVINKTMTECTQEEMLIEVLAQIGLSDALPFVVKYTPSLLDPRNETMDKVLGWGDPTFGHSPHSKESTPALNHFHSRGVTLAGAWTQFHYTQEGAAESGKLAAKHVLDAFQMTPSQPLTIGWDERWEIEWVRDIDRIMFRLGLPCEATYVVIISSFAITFYIALKAVFKLLQTTFKIESKEEERAFACYHMKGTFQTQ